MSRKMWDKHVSTEFHQLSGPAVHALTQVAGSLASWQYAAVHALLADLAYDAAIARTQAKLGPQPALSR